MHVLVDLGHPAHFHLYKNLIRLLEEHGHEVMITARDKEVLLQLLDRQGHGYRCLSKRGENCIQLATEVIVRDYKLLKLCRSFKPDLMIGVSEIIAHIGSLLRIPSIVMTDTEHATIPNLVTFPFADVILTPSFFLKDLGEKHVRYQSHKELAYLHPRYFKPNPDCLEELGVDPGEKIAILRFVSWGSIHDVGHRGILDRRGLIQKLEDSARVFITAEGKLPKALEPYRLPLAPDQFHDLLYYSTLYIGEGGTAASEAAVLGTHAIFISTLAKYCGVWSNLMKYDLMRISETEDPVLDQAIGLLQDEKTFSHGKEKRKRLLNDTIDPTQFLLWFVEKFPESVDILRENPAYQMQFR